MLSCVLLLSDPQKIQGMEHLEPEMPTLTTIF